MFAYMLKDFNGFYLIYLCLQEIATGTGVYIVNCILWCSE